VDRPLVVRVVAAGAAALPLARGTRLGEVRVFSGRKLVAREALVAEHSVDRPGVAGRVGFYVRRALSHVRDWFT
jgi:hypothetical protein